MRLAKATETWVSIKTYLLWMVRSAEDEKNRQLSMGNRLFGSSLYGLDRFGLEAGLLLRVVRDAPAAAESLCRVITPSIRR